MRISHVCIVIEIGDEDIKPYNSTYNNWQCEYNGHHGMQSCYQTK